MDTIEITTQTGIKRYTNVSDVSYRHGYLTVYYQQDGAQKTAKIELEYIISFQVF